jgi:hypothetical protein
MPYLRNEFRQILLDLFWLLKSCEMTTLVHIISPEQPSIFYSGILPAHAH